MEEKMPKQFNEPLRARLQAYREKENLSLADLAGEIGSNVSTVSTYLNKKPEGDVAKFEARVEDILLAAAKRDQSEYRLFPTKVTQIIEGTLEKIRKTNDMGLIFGPAGTGKTCGAKLYQLRHLSSIYIFIPQWLRGPTDLINSIWDASSTAGWDGHTKRSSFLADKFTGTNRLFIVDNAQRLTKDGLNYFFDFHDVTGCPIGFLSNPELQERIADNDTLFSRIGVKKFVTVGNDLHHIADNMLAQLCNGDAGEIMDLALQVLEKQGHARALYKQVRLAKEIHDKTGSPLRTCFKSAHKQLIRDYTLKLRKDEHQQKDEE